LFLIKLLIFHGGWGLGIGDWGLGIGDWAQSPIPKIIPFKQIYYYKIFILIIKYYKKYFF
jgi:hypothetical protein